jgi:hypothetical protein
LTTTGAVTGVGVAAGGALSGATTGAFSGIITNTIQALFISQDGLVETSTTATTAQSPIQRSPRIRITGQVWDAWGSITRSVNFINEVVPRVGNTGINSSAYMFWDFGYTLEDVNMTPMMALGSNGTLDVFGTILGQELLTNGNFTTNTDWNYTGGWFINTTWGMANFTYVAGAKSTGNLTENLSTVIKPNRWYSISYNVSRIGVAGCLAYVDSSFAKERIYLPGVSLTPVGYYDVQFKTNSNPQNFTINATCTAGSFWLDNVSLREVQSGDIIANGLFTGGGTTGIKIDNYGRVGINTTTPQNTLNVIGTANVTGGYAVNESTGITGNYSTGTCYLSFKGGILYATNCTAL